MSEEDTPYTILRKVLKSPLAEHHSTSISRASTLGTKRDSSSQRNQRKENLLSRSSMLPSTVMGLISLKVQEDEADRLLRLV
jgi:hypothetical protein